MGDCCSKEENSNSFDAFNNLNDSRHVMLLKKPKQSEEDEFPIQSGYVPRKKHISKGKRKKLEEAKAKIAATE